MKKITVTLLLLAITLLATAGPVSKQQALNQANAFLRTRGLQVAGEPQRAPGNTSGANHQPLYVFNTVGNHGFVIISGDDRAVPLLGYTEEGRYDEENMPDNFRSWLEQMALEISALPDTNDGQGVSQPLRVPVHTTISPLIKTKWNQGSATATGYIYNTLTPTINNLHCVTGCVATAGAQVMNFYQYPKKATKAVPGYTPNSTIGELSSLPSVTFDWANMKNIYSSADVGTPSEKAVSQLMLYAGYAALMNYGLNGSGASEYQLAVGMAEYFDYDPYTWQYVNRSDYSISEWDALIYGELKAGRPVIYSGDGIYGGHAFICDGYNEEGLYHFNWGWGGQYDGYFKLHATDPYHGTEVYDGTIDNGFPMNAAAVIGLQPNTGQGPGSGSQTGDLVATALDPAIDGNVISALLQNNNAGTAYLALGMGELKADGSITTLDKSYEVYKNWELPSGYYFTSRLTFDVSKYNLSNGTHTLVFISTEKNATGWVRARPYSLYYDVVVKNGSYTITERKSILQAKQFDFTGNKYATVAQPVEVTIECQNIDYIEPLYFFASTSSSNKGECTFSAGTAIEAGQTETVTFYFYPENAGKYYVWVCTDPEGNNVVGTSNVTIKAKPTYKVTLSKVDLSIDAKPTTTATVRVKNTSSYDYYDSFSANLYIHANNSYTYVSGEETPVYLIKAGETKEIKVKFYDLEPDTPYNFDFRYRQNVGGYYTILYDVDFSFSNPTVLPGDVNMDELINVTDVALIVERVLTGNDPEGYHHEYADVNNDNSVNVTDVTILINQILKKDN